MTELVFLALGILLGGLTMLSVVMDRDDKAFKARLAEKAKQAQKGEEVERAALEEGLKRRCDTCKYGGGFCCHHPASIEVTGSRMTFYEARRDDGPCGVTGKNWERK